MTAPDAIAETTASLHRRHQVLARQCVEGKVSAADRQSFIDDLATAGTVVPAGAERDGLRNLLFFWASDQVNRGERARSAPIPKLAPYEGDAGSDDPAGHMAIGRSASVPGMGGSVAAEPAVASRLATFRGTAAQISGTMGEVLKTLRPITEPPTPIASSMLSGERPHSMSDAEARAVVRIGALARQWRSTDETNRKGYLLTARALQEAAAYVDLDPDIRDLVVASTDEARAKRTTTLFALLLCILVAVLIVAAVVVWRWMLTATENQALYAAAADRARERGQIALEARQSVDALGAGEIGPLKTFLERIGDARPSELAKLQVAGGISTSVGEITSIEAPRRDRKPPAAGNTTNTSEGSCQGFLWFGSKDASRLGDKRNPETLKPDEVVTLNDADVRLRADWPAEGSYAMSAQVGVVPGGASVRVTGMRRIYPRSQPQVWAPVTVPRAFCTKVFLQYVGPAEKRDAVLVALRNLYVQVPPAEEIWTASERAEVRYFWPEDAPMARQVAAALGRFASSDRLRVLSLTDLGSKPQPGTIQVSLDFKT